MNRLLFIPLLLVFVLSLSGQGVTTLPILKIIESSIMPTDSLVAYYTFDDGNADDYSGKNNDGTEVGTVNYIEGHRADGDSAINLQDNTSYINCDNPYDFRKINYPSQGDFSVSCWVYYTSGIDSRIVSTGGATSYEIGMAIGTSQALGMFTPRVRTNTTIYSINAASFVTSSWLHVVITWDASTTTLSLYVNNSFIDSDNTGSSQTSTSLVDVLYIGQRPTSTALDPPPRIDDIAIYNKVLTTDEIESLYNN